ncbi:NAD-dependent dihydroorotate dehydrogenase B electron transfer subunit [Virgibacillus halodenitrificans]|uniref:dihydroorotate dehydrogenase electron transfer subunit n=1 Tax=Virgibacillus halodenitrificans TaxID=1482 RepID=UPI00045C5B8B|nr:dihydroorotate dehydrogenase electron transfer subunit [Virgibacillus halodenitrificans]MYL46585.1 NAD-dependent dihydroorotate dehydrogenase B electron transfer subunit [Virgibacillus halodenitrificans]MYL58887.1 NAD-dependent dihydroorotate dehydrogenase B electron transfer subunit [Virgibacillus halodenitrificans]CDQ35913.1 Dihydroorotate oxidase B, electron transfer subunit [Virgibacillus halodenitrificans]
MIKKVEMLISQRRIIALDTVELTLKNKYISQTARPGQFLHILVEGHSLRRPLSIASINKVAETITVLFKIDGPGTKKLSEYKNGMYLDVLGPNGNGFQIEEHDNTILLIGGGIGVPPMYFLGKHLVEQGKKVISILGFQSAGHVFYEDEFEALGRTIIVTNDGSYGEKGFVTDALRLVEDFDCYYTCGPLPMLKAVTAKLNDCSGYISLEERMGCGVGACFACVIPTNDHFGYKKICKDGPVFHSKEVSL